jgi:hypothetical protein
MAFSALRRRGAGLHYLSLHEASGYAVAANRLMLALAERGVPLRWIPMAHQGGGLWYEPLRVRSVGDTELDRLLAGPARCDTAVAHLTPEYFPYVRAAYPRARIVGHTVWETDRLPRHWPELLEVPGLLVVPCRWNADTIRAAGVSTPVAVVPHVAPRVERAASPTWAAIPEDVFVFYTIATWTARKALWNTVRAYLTAFSRDDPVLLVVKTTHEDRTLTGVHPRTPVDRGTTAWALARLLGEFPRAASVLLVTRELADVEIAALHTRGDCFVSLCRSEGWGLPAFDAAAWGNPVVITGFGGQLDYLDRTTSLLVDYELVPVDDPVGLPSFTPDQRWAEPSVAHGAALLRRVFEQPDPAREAARAGAARIGERYAPARVGEQFMTALA